ncbi:MAG: hypothetical protein K2Y28_11080 [Burkholderiaceae bacterium]|nr:hypothetical protein [Burkholderiaceae bacterium]
MDDVRHILPFMIPIIAILMGLGISMLAIWLEYKKKTRLFELHHKERLLAIERGMDVPPLPPEFFMRLRGSELDAKASSLRRGLQLLMVGLALGVALLINFGPDAAVWALLPIALGLAYLIFFKIGGAALLEADSSKTEHH